MIYKISKVVIVSVLAAVVANGAVAQTLFNFAGSSGGIAASTPVGGSSNCFAVSGISTAVYSQSLVNPTAAILVPVAGTCSAVSFQGALTTAPAAWSDLDAAIVVLKGSTGLGVGGTRSAQSVCDFNPGGVGGNPGNATCSATVALSPTIAAGDQIAICFRSVYATPPSTAMAWNVRCNAP
ncbi:hypothetical protein [Telmatospirillum siberiense]|uniref:Secreted protein n=1 Tax=Telmatospirillum siberiense TaxID=382514 RepID=A0A2N3PXL9_9PROT|nr:hypothetical protein [Telmatospirillum siberiense]PKU25138.1 hypothetical protein CWS72_08035 [Telmatospirillum siberiense]